MATALIDRITTRRKSFLEREFPTGGGFKEVVITPAIAEELLNSNPDNRRISDRRVQQYAADMRSGKWDHNGQPIIIADTGELNDGQHRLYACIESGVSFVTDLRAGVARDTRTTLDQNKTRGAGDYLSMLGFPSPNNIASMAKMAIAYEKTGGKTINVPRDVTNADALEYVEAHGAALLEAFRFADRASASLRGTPATVLGLCAYVLRGKGDLANQYLEQVLFGENISLTDPAYRVRERLAGIVKGNRNVRVEAILRGWVAFKNGKPLTLIKILGELPAI